MKTREILYTVNKQINRVLAIEERFSPLKKIFLHDKEAKMLLDRGVEIYEEIRTFPNGSTRTIYFCYVSLEELANIAKR